MEKLKLNHDEKNLIKFIDLGSLALGLNLSEKITDKFIDYINMINSYQKKLISPQFIIPMKLFVNIFWIHFLVPIY